MSLGNSWERRRRDCLGRIERCGSAIVQNESLEYTPYRLQDEYWRLHREYDNLLNEGRRVG